MTQTQLGDCLDIDDRYVRRWEKGEAVPSAQYQSLLAEVVHGPVSGFISSFSLLHCHERHSVTSVPASIVLSGGHKEVQADADLPAIAPSHLEICPHCVKLMLRRHDLIGEYEGFTARHVVTTDSRAEIHEFSCRSMDWFGPRQIIFECRTKPVEQAVVPRPLRRLRTIPVSAAGTRVLPALSERDQLEA